MCINLIIICAFTKIMANKFVLLFLVVMVAAMSENSRALSFCKMDENGLSACKPSVTKPDPVAPSADCCKALSGADLSCLCDYKSSPILPALGIDPDLAMALPSKCSLPLPAGCQGS